MNDAAPTPLATKIRIRLHLDHQDRENKLDPFFTSVLTSDEPSGEQRRITHFSPLLDSIGCDEAISAVAQCAVYEIIRKFAPEDQWWKYDFIDGVVLDSAEQPVDDGVRHEVGDKDMKAYVSGDEVVLDYHSTLPETYSAYLAIERYLQANLSPLIVEKLSALKP